MLCPRNCPTPLVITDRSGVEIDYCPTCRGVWLDRGELDKIIERAASFAGTPTGPREPAIPGSPSEVYRHEERRYDDDDDDRRYGKRKKKGGFLGDLFDFD